jgi:signal transduction histidine kinase
MESQQVMEMLKTLLVNQEKADVDRKAYREDLKEMKANMRSMQVELKSTIKNFKFNGEETTACQEKTEACLQEEPTSENRAKGVGTDNIWPHSAARRRNRTKTWARGVAGKNKTGP